MTIDSFCHPWILVAAVDFYLDNAPQVAGRFVEATERCLQTSAKSPGAGSARVGDLLDIPGLRCRAVTGFPYLVFYRFTSDEVIVGRLLHEARDLEALLADFSS